MATDKSTQQSDNQTDADLQPASSKEPGAFDYAKAAATNYGAEKAADVAIEKGGEQLSKKLGLESAAESAGEVAGEGGVDAAEIAGGGKAASKYRNAKASVQRGYQDRKAGKSAHEAFKSEHKFRKAQSLANQEARGVAKGVAAEGARDVAAGAATATAATTAEAAAAGAAKTTAAVAGKEIPLITAVDYKGIRDTTKQTFQAARQGQYGTAARKLVTGATKTVLVTLFKASYDFYVIGYTLGLSLIATYILGNIVFFLPGLTIMQRILAGAMVILTILLGVGILAGILFMITCSPVAIGINTFLSTVAALFLGTGIGTGCPVLPV